MKNKVTFSNSLALYPFGKGQLLSSLATHTKFLTFEEFTPTPMKENEIKPPQHVWDNISKILDEQEKQRLNCKSCVNVQSSPTTTPIRTFIFLSILLGAAAIAFWYFSRL